MINLMQGIEVVGKAHGGFWTADLVVTTVYIVASYLYGISVVLKQKKADRHIKLVGISFIMLLGTMCLSLVHQIRVVERSYDVRYVVTLDEDINKREFRAKYDVVTRAGKLYLIKEKEEEEQ